MKKIYLYNIYNYIDNLYLSFTLLFLIFTFLDYRLIFLSQTQYLQHDFIISMQYIIFVVTVIFNSFRVMTIWSVVFPQVGLMVEATIFIILDAFIYILGVSILWFSLSFSGFIMYSNMNFSKCESDSLYSCTVFSVKTMLSLEDWPDDWDEVPYWQEQWSTDFERRHSILLQEIGKIPEKLGKCTDPNYVESTALAMENATQPVDAEPTSPTNLYEYRFDGNYASFARGIYWVLNVILLVVIIYNGLIAIMCYNLENSMSEENLRLRSSMRKYKRILAMEKALISHSCTVAKPEDQPCQSGKFFKMFTFSEQSNLIDCNKFKFSSPREKDLYLHFYQQQICLSLRTIIAGFESNEDVDLPTTVATLLECPIFELKKGDMFPNLLNLLAKLEPAFEDAGILDSVRDLINQSPELLTYPNPTRVGNLESLLHNIFKNNNSKFYEAIMDCHLNDDLLDRDGLRPSSSSFGSDGGCSGGAASEISKNSKLFQAQTKFYAKLFELYHDFNKSIIHEIDFSNKKLTWDFIKSSNLVKFPGLKKIYCKNCQLEELTLIDSVIRTERLIQVESLEELDFSHNYLEEFRIHLRAFENLKIMRLNDNKIKKMTYDSWSTTPRDHLLRPFFLISRGDFSYSGQIILI